MKMLQHNGYFGSIEASVEDDVLHGKMEFISALVTYEADTVSDLKHAFEEAVEDYIQTCKDQGYQPEVPCKGSFNVRLGHDLHLAAAVKAKEMGVSLNDLVRGATNKLLTTV